MKGAKKNTDQDLALKVVRLGSTIRRLRLDGDLQSVTPPTIWGYLAFLRMARALPHLSMQQISMATLLGNASLEDRKLITSVLNEVFGLQASDKDDPTMDVNLF